jgi:CDP-glucose 4,6-dehydratase
VVVRNPHAVRPWQHVLEPTSGYLWLASRLFTHGHTFDGAWNFGPAPSGNLTVRQVVDTVVAEWGSGSWIGPRPAASSPPEAHFLKLDISKTVDILEWHPVWGASQALRSTTRWYREFYSGATAAELTRECLSSFLSAACSDALAWTR